MRLVNSVEWFKQWCSDEKCLGGTVLESSRERTRPQYPAGALGVLFQDKNEFLRNITSIFKHINTHSEEHPRQA